MTEIHSKFNHMLRERLGLYALSLKKHLYETHGWYKAHQLYLRSNVINKLRAQVLNNSK